MQPVRMFVPTPEQLSASAAAAVDTHRLIDLVQQVCRIPSVLGEEGELPASCTR